MASFLDPRRMYTQIPSALATPPQSPSDEGWPSNQAAEMPLVTDLLTRNGQLNVPPGFVLCIPCYLCKQPFNDIETFKEHLTQHAAEIYAWHMAREQASQEPPTQPMFQHYPQHNGQPPMVQPAGPYILPMEFPQQQQQQQQPPPPMVSIPGPIQPPPMAFPMALSKPLMMGQPPMQFPMQMHQQMGVQSPLEFPGHCPVPQPQPREFPVHRQVPLIPETPLEMMEHQFGFPKIRPIPQPHQPPMELQRKPHFVGQQPLVELQRIVLQKPLPAGDRHQPKEQPRKMPEKNAMDKFSIESLLRIPPSMEVQRIVLPPIEAKENDIPVEPPQPQPQSSEESTQRHLPIVLQKEIPQKPSQVPHEHRFQCEWCGKKLSSRQSVRYHESRFHLMDDPPTYKLGKTAQKHFKCATCKKRYKRRTFLLMHLKIKHGICGGAAAADGTIIPTTTVASPPVEVPSSPERPASPSSSEEERREVWSTKIFNAVAAANYNPATEPAAKYVNTPRQQSEHPEPTVEYAVKPKRVYPMRSPFFNPDLWLDCDAYF